MEGGATGLCRAWGGAEPGVSGKLEVEGGQGFGENTSSQMESETPFGCRRRTPVRGLGPEKGLTSIGSLEWCPCLSTNPRDTCP